MKIQKGVRRVYSAKKIKADDEIMEEDLPTEAPVEEGGEVVVDPEATELMFEAEDVAELVAEVTGESVEVTVEDDAVTFTIGEDEFVVEPEGDEEILETSRKVLKGKKPVAASTKRPVRKPAQKKAPVKASRPLKRR